MNPSWDRRRQQNVHISISSHLFWTHGVLYPVAKDIHVFIQSQRAEISDNFSVHITTLKFSL